MRRARTAASVMSKSNVYAAIIEEIFLSKYAPGMTQVDFERSDLTAAAERRGIPVPSNVGDVVYSARYRRTLPESVQATAAAGYEWIIRGMGRGRYCFVLTRPIRLAPNEQMVVTKVPDATPGVVAMYALGDEQALLARVRYNRLIDIFTGVTCYSLQNHLRTSVPNVGQVETDELYVGVDRKGCQYVLPVQAKGGSDTLNIVQIEQDMALCEYRFPELVCRPVAAQFMDDDVIALFAFEKTAGEVKVLVEGHYRLVDPNELTDADLAAYRRRA